MLLVYYVPLLDQNRIAQFVCWSFSNVIIYKTDSKEFTTEQYMKFEELTIELVKRESNVEMIEKRGTMLFVMEVVHFAGMLQQRDVTDPSAADGIFKSG